MKRFVTLCAFAVILFLTGCGKKAETIVIPLRIQVSFEEAFGTSFSEALKTWQEEFLQDMD
ncbi:MAG: hypothetical protein E7295_02305 [Lachnospiraceae bacterium]|jgi:hypothetical protein|nr:hypothetical protein [Lachnospiraceae bacterium]